MLTNRIFTLFSFTQCLYLVIVAMILKLSSCVFLLWCVNAYVWSRLEGYVSTSAIHGCYLLWLMMYHEDHRVGRQVGEGTATVAARPVTNIETRPVRIVVEDASVIRRVDCKLRLLFTLRKLCAGWHYVICPPDNPYAHSC